MVLRVRARKLRPAGPQAPAWGGAARGAGKGVRVPVCGCHAQSGGGIQAARRAGDAQEPPSRSRRQCVLFPDD